MKKVFLTGGHGFFGSRFKEKYRYKFDIFSPDRRELDILDREKVFNMLKLYRPDYVIHGAAIALTAFCNENPEQCQAVNVTGAVNVAQACEALGARMIFLSTEQVFNGNPEAGPYKETDKALPDTVYGKNKLEAERKLESILDDFLVLRFTWMFGVPERSRRVVNNILWDTITSIMKGEQIKAPCHEYRGFTYVNEVLDSFEQIMDLPGGIYHTGSQNDLSRYDVVRFIFNELGLEKRIPELLVRDEEKYAGHPRDARLDTSLIQDSGIPFSETGEAIGKCIREYSLRIN